MPMEMTRELEGAVLDGSVRLLSLETTDGGPIYAGEATNGQPVMVRVLPDDPAFGPVLDRYREASFFDHPNLLNCRYTGWFDQGGRSHIYAALDAPDVLLSEVLQEGALSPQEAQRLGLDLVAGLSYLHDRGLVHCGLSPTAVARVDGQWKIADYGLIRLSGGGYQGETRRMLARMPSTPPEAFEGLVTPAWDSWQLGNLLQTALTGTRRGSREEGRHLHRKQLPEPFASLVLGCLSPNPTARYTMEQIERLLSEELGSVPEPVSAPQPSIPEPAFQPQPKRRAATPAVGMHAAGIARRLGTLFTPLQLQLLVILLGALALLAIVAIFNQSTGNSVTPPASQRGEAANPPAAAPLEITPPQAAAQRPDPSQPPQASVTDESRIYTLLQQWTKAGKAGDVQGQVSLYAPKVERFYQSYNVSRDWIRRYRERGLAGTGTVRKFDIDHIQARIIRPDRAVVSFDKRWDFERGRASSGQVRSELGLSRVNGQWLINSERDIKVYWTRSS